MDIDIFQYHVIKIQIMFEADRNLREFVRFIRFLK